MRTSSRAGGRLGPPDGGNERVRSSFGMHGSVPQPRSRPHVRPTCGRFALAGGTAGVQLSRAHATGGDRTMTIRRLFTLALAPALIAGVRAFMVIPGRCSAGSETFAECQLLRRE